MLEGLTGEAFVSPCYAVGKKGLQLKLIVPHSTIKKLSLVAGTVVECDLRVLSRANEVKSNVPKLEKKPDGSDFVVSSPDYPGRTYRNKRTASAFAGID